MLKIVWLAIFACLLGLSAFHALEFMDDSASYEENAPRPQQRPLPRTHFGAYNDDDDDDDRGEGVDESAESPVDLSYRRDTITNFKPTKVDTNFKHLWEQVPLTRKVDTIKK